VIDLEDQASGDKYTIVEEMPLFDGAIDQDESNKKVNNYLEKGVKSDRHYKKGTVFISFVVNQDGRTENIKILRGINDKIDAKAIKYISEMPDWKAGEQRGKKIKVQYTFPIKFK